MLSVNKNDKKIRKIPTRHKVYHHYLDVKGTAYILG